MNNILLTGSSGFIGQYFIKTYQKSYNIQTFSFLKDSLNSLELNATDVVVHLSALVHQMGGASEDEYERVNVTQTLELAKKAKVSGVKHFIFMSSVKVYGEESSSVYTEQTPLHPQDAYGASKRKAESELLKLEDENFRVSIIRTPIVYGYGVKANIKSLVSLVSKVSILPFGGITNRRSMVYIGNLCHLMEVIIDKNASGIYLAGDDRPLSTTELIESIAEALDKKIYLLQIPFFPQLLKLLKPSFYQRLYGNLELNTQKTNKRLAFTNKYSSKEGINLMILGEEK
jgi:nucleoside-diphosphate-sugar epimerase